MAQTINVTVTSIRMVKSNIIRLEIFRPADYQFVPGQFARIGISSDDKVGSTVWRAQTIASRPEGPALTFYIVYLENQQFSEPLKRIKQGDQIFLDAVSYGHFTLDRFSAGGDIWLFSTGSGIAPYLCMLQQKKIWEDFANIILISSFKDETQFVYEESLPLTFERLSSFQLENYHKFSFVPVFTRKKVVSECIVKGIKTDSVFSGAYFEEIISNGALNLILKNSISAKNSKVMLSGNPNMIKTTRNYLKTLDLRSSRRDSPGQIAVENYW